MIHTFIGITLFAIILTVWAIVDLFLRDFGSAKKKVLWGIVAFVPYLGGPVYLIFGRRQGKRIAAE